MRLLFLSNVHPNPLNPQKGTFNGALVRALGKQHDVQVVCPISWIDKLRARGGRLPNRPVLLQPTVTASYPTFWYPPKVLRSYYDRFLEWSIQRHLLRGTQSERPDAIVSYWAHPDGTVAVRLARRLGVPAITMVGGSDILLLGRGGQRRRAIQKTLLQSDAVIGVSDDIAHQVVGYGVPEERVHVVRRGIDRDLFHPGDKSTARAKLGLPQNAHILVGVGRLVPVKDWPNLIEACALLNSGGTPIHCYLLGDGELRGPLEQQIARHGLQDRIVLQGSQSQTALADWYRAADLVVLSSVSEGIPNVLLEAISSGAPFVATRVGGIPEIADSALHRLVPVGQPAAMAAAIRERLELGPVNSLPRFHPPSWEDSADEIVAIINQCRQMKSSVVGHDRYFRPRANNSVPSENLGRADQLANEGIYQR